MWTRDDQVRHDQRMATLGRLAVAAVHDLNNILAAITCSASILTRALGDQPSLLRMADHITDAADNAKHLTRNLLALSRRPASRPALYDVHEVVEAACRLLAGTMGRDIDVELRLEAIVRTGVGEATQLQNALLNLGFNARDAMPDGGTLRIATRNVRFAACDCERIPFALEPGDYVEIAVSDTGAGMDEEVARRAFEPFFTTKAVGQGTGLGLSAVHEAIIDHRGAIELRSRPGAGTTFRMFLPVGASSDAAAATPPVPRRHAAAQTM
jgi:two-component system, cell cycle sensor histidine kinase and response regulator CckA